MPLYFSPVGNDQTFDANGDPLNAGQIETYIAGSSTPLATFTDDSGSTPQSNPIILNSLGYPTLGPIWLTGGQSYKFIIKDSLGVTLRTIDNISGVNDATVSQSEWVESGFTPTYINATSFSVPGDQTAILQVNRRTRTTNTSGFIYSTISNSVFAAGITTVTLVNDSGTLDAGLSSVAYGLLSSTDSAIPVIQISGGGTGQTTALAGFDALKQPATDSYAGVSELATDAEAQAGTSTSLALTPSTMKAAQIQLGTAVALTNQTGIGFTSIPSWVKRITLNIWSASSNGTDSWQLLLGDSGGLEGSGYAGAVILTINASAVSGAQMSTGFRLLNGATAAGTYVGKATIEKLEGNTWICTGSIARTDVIHLHQFAGSKTLTGTLNQIQLTTLSGIDQFDAGTVNISYE